MCENNEHQLVPFVQGQRDFAALALIFILGKCGTLDDALFGNHGKETVFFKGFHTDHGRDFFLVGDFNEVYQICPLGGPGGFRNLIGLSHKDLAGVGKEHKIRMAVDHRHFLHKVLFLGGHAENSLAALVLSRIGIGRQTLDISGVRERNHTIMPFNKIFQQNIVLRRHDLGAATIGIFAPDLQHLVFDDLLDAADIRKNGAQIGNQRVKSGKFIHDLLLFKTGQLAHGHIDNGLRLHIRKTEPRHKFFFGIRNGSGMTDQIHDLIDIVAGDFITLQNVRPRLGFIQIKPGPPGDDLLLMGNVIIQNLRQGEHFGLIIDQRQHIDGAGILQLSVFIKLIENDLPVGIAAVMNDQIDTVPAVGKVFDIGDTVNFFVFCQCGDGLHQHTFVDLIGQLGDDNAVFILFDFAFGTHHDAAAAGLIGFDNPVYAIAGGGGRKIRPLDILHKVFHGAVRVFHPVNRGVNHFTQIVRRDIGSHTDRNTDGTVYQQIWKSGRKHGRLTQAVIKVRNKRDNLFFKIGHQLVRNFGQSCLGITVRGGTVAVHRTEVTVTFYQRIAHGKILCHAHHGAVYGGITVRMIPAQHITDRGGRFTERLVRGQMILIHGIHDPALTGLHPVPDIRKRA